MILSGNPVRAILMCAGFFFTKNETKILISLDEVLYARYIKR